MAKGGLIFITCRMGCDKAAKVKKNHLKLQKGLQNNSNDKTSTMYMEKYEVISMLIYEVNVTSISQKRLFFQPPYQSMWLLYFLPLPGFEHVTSNFLPVIDQKCTDNSLPLQLRTDFSLDINPVSLIRHKIWNNFFFLLILSS